MRRRLLALLVLCLCAIATVSACAAPVPRSALNRAASQARVVRLSYPVAQADPTQNFGDLFLPAPQQGSRSQLIVLYHGGGWEDDVGVAGLERLAKDLTGRGFAVFNVEYRRVGSGGGWPTTLTDAAAAADFAATLPVRFPRVRGPLILVGHSAGGQLAVWASQHGTSHAAEAISIAGPLALADAARSGDHNAVTLIGGQPDQFPARYAMADPAAQACPVTPTVMVHGTGDRVVPITNARDFLSRPRCPGARVRLVEVMGGTHLSLISPGGVGYSTMMDVITAAARVPV